MNRGHLRLAFWIAAVATGVLYVSMLVFTLPDLLAGPDQLRPFDARPMGYDLAEAQAYLRALDPDARDLYLGLQQRLDLFFPAANALMLILGACLLLRGSSRWVLIGVVVLLTFADYAENTAVRAMLLAEPEAITAEQVAAASRWTMVKSFGTTLAWAALILGAVAHRRRSP